jgi:tetratricopeptide (TPR) repeat protein
VSSFRQVQMIVKIALLVVLLAAGGCSTKRPESQTAGKPDAVAEPAGSSRCKPCHLAFYEKWVTSHHGLAMQPFTPRFGRMHLTTQAAPVRIGAASYRAVLTDVGAYVEEHGPGRSRNLPILHVLGGKNVYYFLTPMERGRLQVLPLAFDVQKGDWYDMPASGVRMHAGVPADAPLPWTDSAYTFNTSCYSCHVSQFRTNYDASTGAYRSTWREPGIDCESCHGEGSAHCELYEKNQDGKFEDIRILRTTRFSTAQRNEMCAPCHAKMTPISRSYEVTQRFFDHYDLLTLEDPDFFPDGRDLGENYTYTGWLMSSCVRGGKLDCIHCHSSSGRYKFATGDSDNACLPCHEDRVAKVEAHSGHKAGSPGGRCIDCHMPKTRFANMNRTDHSMLPPTPASTIRFRSPNACNLCHKDKTPSWADALVRKRHKRDYQGAVLDRASLIDAARKHDWNRLPSMLSYVERGDALPVFKAALLRLLGACDDRRKWPALTRAAQDANPLVRAAAIAGLEADAGTEARDALVRATHDEFRLVRIRAAARLASVPAGLLPASAQDAVASATDELVAAYNARPDDFGSQTNLGTFYLDRGELGKSIRAFEAAIQLRPDSVPTLVNASMAYARANRETDAERVLDQALRVAPDNVAANFNRGLLLAQTRRKREAEASLRKAVVAGPTEAGAAFNLCVLLYEEQRIAEALDFCRRAVKSAPQSEKYAYTLAFYLDRNGQTAEAVKAL